jgi:hypothetical protein
MFQRAEHKSGIEDFHFHDIRAKALTDAKRLGMDAQGLAGQHTNDTKSSLHKKAPPYLPSTIWKSPLDAAISTLLVNSRDNLCGIITSSGVVVSGMVCNILLTFKYNLTSI